MLGGRRPTSAPVKVAPNPPPSAPGTPGDIPDPIPGFGGPNGRRVRSLAAGLGVSRTSSGAIAVFRIQCASYVATHAGAYDTDLYGPKQRYFRRYCVWKECCDAAALDDARHVLLHCPLHDIDRAVMLRSVRTALHNVRLTLEDIGSETAVVQLLLGSVPVTAAHALSAHQTTHRDILRASSKYLKYVYDTRWKYGHNFKQ